MSAIVTPTKRRLQLESLEDRRCLSAASVGWDGPGKGSATLSYHISNVPSYLTEAAVDAAMQTAMQAWSSVAAVKFVKASQANLPNSIDISFAPIDGSGGTLAETYLPADVNPSRIAGDMQFDAAERWEVGNAQGNRAFDLVMVAVHELGHALGLDHTRVANSVMEPTVSPSVAYGHLSQDDIASILSIYAPASKTSTPTAAPTASPLTPTLASGGSTRTTPTTNNPTTSTPTTKTPTTPVAKTPTDSTPTTWTWQVSLWPLNRWTRWYGGSTDAFSWTTPTSGSTWLTNLSNRLNTPWRNWWA